jgi:hypothetical protein
VTDTFVLKDFNHTAQQRHSKADRAEFAALVNTLIDQALVDAHIAEPPRAYNISPSSVGDECLRRVQYQTTRVEGSPPSGKLLRIFARGHIFEDYVAKLMRDAGFDLRVTSPKDGRQYGFQLAKGQIRGRLDGIIMDGPYLPGLLYPCIWECKALGAKGFASCVAKGITEAYPKYAAQGYLYQAYMELEHPELYSVLNADTMELHHEPVPFDEERAQWASDRAVQILEANRCGELLPRAGSDPEKYPCKFCDFRDHCHDGTPLGGDLGPVRKGDQ